MTTPKEPSIQWNSIEWNSDLVQPDPNKPEIITSDGEGPLYNIVVTNGHPQLRFTPEFVTMLSNIETNITNIKPLLEKGLPETINNEDDLVLVETAISELDNLQKTKKTVDEIRKNMRSEVEKIKVALTTEFDKAVTRVGYNELAQLDNKAKSLKQTISATRINMRWDELKALYEANILTYPQIAEVTPRLTDFDTFKIRNPQLVSGSKSGKIGKKHKDAVNESIYEIAEIVNLIKQNQHQLEPYYLMKIIEAFQNNPTKENYLENVTLVIQQRTHDIQVQQEQQLLSQQEQERQLEEQQLMQRQAQLEQQASQQNQSPEAQAQLLQQQQDLYNHQQEVFQKQQLLQNQQQQLAQKLQNDRSEAHKWVADYINNNRMVYAKISNNNDLKVKLIYELMGTLHQPTSPFYMFTQGDSDKIMAVINYISGL